MASIEVEKKIGSDPIAECEKRENWNRKRARLNQVGSRNQGERKNP